MKPWFTVNLSLVLSVGVCNYISSAINIVIVVLTMCNLTISSIFAKPLCGDEGVKQCTCAIRACSFTAGLKCIVLMYIFTFHIVKITQRVLFFSSQISMITNVILVLYNS